MISLRNKAFVLLVITCLFSFLLPITSHAAVWKDTQTWNDEWEVRYQQWVQAEWTADKFMDGRNPDYFLIPHDCADAVYLMRLLFAYENQLPFVIKDPGNVRRTISNKFTKWDKIKDDNKRLRRFIHFVNQAVGTKSLPNDTYPIRLADLKPGDIYVTPGTHSYQIRNITETGVPVIMSSTTPSSPKYFTKLTSFPFFIPESKRKHDGYRRFIQPQNLRKPLKNQPGYSEEQFEIAAKTNYNFISFTDVMAKQLGKRPETQEERSERVIGALCSFAQERTDAVTSAVFYIENIRSHTKRQCMDAKEYDYYSTPSRDKRLKRFFEEVRRVAMSQSKQSNPHQWSALRVARAIFEVQPTPRDLRDLNHFCQIPIVEEGKKTIGLRELWKGLASNRVSSDPNAPLEARWGLVEMPYKATCKTF